MGRGKAGCRAAPAGERARGLMVRARAEAVVMVFGRADHRTTSGRSERRYRRTGSTAQHPPRRTQDQEQAATEDEKAVDHGVLLWRKHSNWA